MQGFKQGRTRRCVKPHIEQDHGEAANGAAYGSLFGAFYSNSCSSPVTIASNKGIGPKHHPLPKGQLGLPPMGWAGQYVSQPQNHHCDQDWGHKQFLTKPLSHFGKRCTYSSIRLSHRLNPGTQVPVPVPVAHCTIALSPAPALHTLCAMLVLAAAVTPPEPPPHCQVA